MVNKVHLEPLEPRILLSSDFTNPYQMAGAVNDLTLRLRDVDGTDTIQLINNNDVDPLTQIVAQQSLATTTVVTIDGSEFNDNLIIDFNNPFSKNIFFDDSSPSDSDTLKVIGNNIYPLDVTGENSGTIDNSGTAINYSGIENVRVGNLSNFVNLDSESLQGVFGQIKDWMAEFSGAEQFNIEIPFVDTSFSDVLDFGTAFKAGVVSKIDFNKIDTLQDLVTEITDAGLIPSIEEVSFDSLTQTLTIPIKFEMDLDAMSLRDLDDLGLLDLNMLAEDGLIQIGPYADQDDLLDHGYVSINQLAGLGLLDEDVALPPDRLDLHLIEPALPVPRHEIDATVVHLRRVHLKAVHRELHLHEVLGVPADLLAIEPSPTESRHAPLPCSVARGQLAGSGPDTRQR